MDDKKKPRLQLRLRIQRGFARTISLVEATGNLLPHPFTLFLILIAVVLLLSAGLSPLGISASYTAADPTTGQEATHTVAVQNLLARGELQRTMEGFVKTFVYFAPVGLVLVMILGVSLAEQAGLFSAAIRQLIARTPAPLVTFTVALVGISANIASDAGIVIAPAVGAAVFLALGRHPVAGVCAGYVAAYGGYSANVFVAGTDVTLAGITEAAIRHFDPDIAVHPLMNWYVMVGSTLLLATVVTFITERIVIPYLGAYDPPDELRALAAPVELAVSNQERRGLRAAALAAVLFIAGVLALIVSEGGILRNDGGGILPRSPFISGIIFILFCFFFVVGVTYGVAARTITSEKEIPKMMARGMSGVAGFLVVCLPASVFIDLFHRSNLTTIIAVEGAELFGKLAIGAIPMLLMFSLLCAAMNIFITSGFTQWMLTAPIFVPLFYQLGLSPAITQMAFRIGDSTTNIISPISAYLPMLLGLLEKYRNRGQEIGIGSALGLMLPYSTLLLVFWLIYFGVWLLLGLDPGPGVSIRV